MAFEPTKDRPVLSDKARHGIMGEILDLVEPQTEADPAGIIATTLATFSCMIGVGRKVTGPITQPINAWFILMGETGIGRKGTADNVVASYMSDVYPWFWENCRTPSLSTGEGLTYSVRDIGHLVIDDEDVTEGEEDIKQMLVTSTEFAGVMSKSQGGTLGPVLRDAWDGKNLAIHTKDAYHSTAPHITVIGHVTPTEFGAKLKSHDMAGGTYNRFLPMFVEMPHELPWPERPENYDEKLQEFSGRLKKAVEFGTILGTVEFGVEAKAYYITHIYPEYNDTREDSEVMKQFTTRRLPYVMRVAAIYALMNERDVISIEDLQAAKAVVDYSMESARFVQEHISVTGPRKRGPKGKTFEEDLDKLREAIQRSGPGGLSRTHISVKVFQARKSKEELNKLLKESNASMRPLSGPSGRQREIYYYPNHEEIEGEK